MTTDSRYLPTTTTTNKLKTLDRCSRMESPLADEVTHVKRRGRAQFSTVITATRLRATSDVELMDMDPDFENWVMAQVTHAPNHQPRESEGIEICVALTQMLDESVLSKNTGINLLSRIPNGLKNATMKQY